MPRGYPDFALSFSVLRESNQPSEVRRKLGALRKWVVKTSIRIFIEFNARLRLLRHRNFHGLPLGFLPID
jgi:hypothetical protein